MTLTEPTRIIFRKAHVTEREAVLSTFSTATQNYLIAVEAADQQTLELEVLKVMGQFAEYRIPLGGACCLMAGARTLAGALVPMVGAAPTNVGGLFVAGDYDRTTGLVGNGSTKYLDSNRNNNADGQNDQHLACFVASYPGGDSGLMGAGVFASSGNSYLLKGNTISTKSQMGSSISTAGAEVGVKPAGLFAVSRNSSANYNIRLNSATSSSSIASVAALFNGSILVFARGTTGSPDQATNARLSYYSIGPSVDLTAMDTAITTCMNALAAAGI